LRNTARFSDMVLATEEQERRKPATMTEADPIQRPRTNANCLRTRRRGPASTPLRYGMLCNGWLQYPGPETGDWEIDGVSLADVLYNCVPGRTS
jgi:hypothetical protein